MNTLKWMKDYPGNKFYPYTHTDAVLVGNDEENLRNLTDELNQINNKITESVSGTQSDWNETDETSPSYIKNKPTALLSEGSIDQSLLSSDLQANIQSSAEHLSNTQIHIPNGGDVGQVIGMTANGVEWVDSDRSNPNDNYATKAEMNIALSTKVDKEEGKELISNDEKTKLSNLPNITFSNTIPTSLSENTICFVYETEEGTS